MSECLTSVERTSDNILKIHDVTSDRYFGITTEIDFSDRTIRKTWKAFVFTWHKVYSLDNYLTVETQDKSRLMEGYRLALFVVSLIGRGNRIKIYSTDDFDDAKAVQKELTDFLYRTQLSTRQQQ